MASSSEAAAAASTAAAADSSEVAYALLESLESGVCALFSGVKWAYEEQLLPLYEQHVRRSEYRAMTLDNDIMQCVAELRSVKVLVQQRILELREQSTERGAQALRCVTETGFSDARDQFRLKMLYDAQYEKAQRTLMAIEAHVVSMEASLVNRRVMRALRSAAISTNTNTEKEEQDEFDDALDDLAEHNRTSQLVRESIEGAPDMLTNDSEVDEHMRRWLAVHQTCAAAVAAAPPTSGPPPPPPPPPAAAEATATPLHAAEEFEEEAPDDRHLFRVRQHEEEAVLA